jgi:hypothetical protein
MAKSRAMELCKEHISRVAAFSVSLIKRERERERERESLCV